MVAADIHGTKELVIEPVGQAGQEPGGGGIIAGSIAGDRFLINGKPTYEGRTYRGNRIEGLLLKSPVPQKTEASAATEGVIRTIRLN